MESFEHPRVRGRAAFSCIAIVRVFAVASLVFLTSTAANVTVDVSVSVGLGDDLVLSRRGRGGLLWLDLNNPGSARGPSGVGAEIYA